MDADLSGRVDTLPSSARTLDLPAARDWLSTSDAGAEPTEARSAAWLLLSMIERGDPASIRMRELLRTLADAVPVREVNRA